MEVERTEAQHKQWQESQSQGLQAQSSCEKKEEKADNNQLSEMVSTKHCSIENFLQQRDSVIVLFDSF